MNIKVTFRNMKTSDAIRDYAIRKLEKVKKFLPHSEPIDINIVLSLEKHRHIADVVVNAKDITMSAKEETEDIYSAIDLVADSVEKQARRYRDKIKTKKSSFKEVISLKEGSFSESSTEKPVVVRVEDINTKPMTIDEAVMELDSGRKGFVIFTNAESGKVSLLYKRDDGNYGLYEFD